MNSSQTLRSTTKSRQGTIKCVCNLCCGKHSCPLHPSRSEDAERCICEICNCTFHHCPVHAKAPAKGDTTHRIHYPEHPLEQRSPFPRDDPAGDGVPFLGRTTYESHYPGHAVRARQKLGVPLPEVAPHAVPLSTEHRDGYLRPQSRAHGEGRKHNTLLPDAGVDPLDPWTTAHRDHFVPKSAPAQAPHVQSQVSLALPRPAALTTTLRDHFPEHGLASGLGPFPPAPDRSRALPFAGTTEHRDEYTPKEALRSAAIPVPDYLAEEPCPAIPLMASIPGPASPAWRGDHVKFDTLQGGWSMRGGGGAQQHQQLGGSSAFPSLSLSPASGGVDAGTSGQFLASTSGWGGRPLR